MDGAKLGFPCDTSEWFESGRSEVQSHSMAEVEMVVMGEYDNLFQVEGIMLCDDVEVSWPWGLSLDGW